MHSLHRVIVVSSLAFLACGPSAPAPESPPKSTSAPPTDGPPPTVPPNPVKATEAFHIASIDAPARPASATVCATDAECSPQVPPGGPVIARHFDLEAWVVIQTPPSHKVTVTSDGSGATVTLTGECPAGPKTPRSAQVTLYRVAKTVTKATVKTEPPPKDCPKEP